MLRWLTDINFDGRILRGLFRRIPEADIVRAQDVGLEGIEDPELLEWAAAEGRIVLSHDKKTLPGFALDRIARQLRMPGLVVVPLELSVGRALEDLILLVRAGTPKDFQNPVRYLPL